jgi:hypothetical protein
MEMKMLVNNVIRTHGTKKADGKPYDMYVITVSMPVQNVSQGTYNQEGYGTIPATMELDPAIFHNFKNLKDPVYLDLTIEQVLHFGEIKNMVTGVSNVQPQQAKVA